MYVGHFSTILMYGQTGSGKTYTMTSIQERASVELFQLFDQENRNAKTSAPAPKPPVRDRNQPPSYHGNNSGKGEEVKISVSFVELAGTSCSDCLNAGKPVELVAAQDGNVYALAVVEVPVSSAGELIALITHAQSQRATAATGVHDRSSRSHAVVTVYITRGQQEGVLTLVDLAGSEHRIDSAKHDKQRRKECSQINASLMALKDCIRVKAARARGEKLGNERFISYRGNKLTHLLKRSLDDPDALTVVIATVAPSSKDTEHSLNTIRHACLMDGQGEKSNQGGASYLAVAGEHSQLERLGPINVTAIARKNRENAKKNKAKNNGYTNSRPRTGGSSHSSSGGGFGYGDKSKGGIGDQSNPQKEKAKEERKRLRADRQALNAMNPSFSRLLLDSREDVGAFQPQLNRLARAQGGRSLGMARQKRHSITNKNKGNSSSNGSNFNKPKRGVVASAGGSRGDRTHNNRNKANNSKRPPVREVKKDKKERKWVGIGEEAQPTQERSNTPDTLRYDNADDNDVFIQINPNNPNHPNNRFNNNNKSPPVKASIQPAVDTTPQPSAAPSVLKPSGPAARQGQGRVSGRQAELRELEATIAAGLFNRGLFIRAIRISMCICGVQ